MRIPNARGWKRPVKKKDQEEAGARLQALLDSARLSQAEAADMIGVDHRTMRRYVLGQTTYPYSVLFAIEVLCDAEEYERPKVTALRKLKREELDAELDKWRGEQAKWPNASKAFARAAEHVRAIHDEFIRRDERRSSASVG